jgi:hypothetical protein
MRGAATPDNNAWRSHAKAKRSVPGETRKSEDGLAVSRHGAIAQLGERVLCKHEVVGSIPSGSTTLRPSGYAWRSHVIAEAPSVPGVDHLGEDEPSTRPNNVRENITSHAPSFTGCDMRDF